MTLQDFALKVLEATETAELDFMVVGALAAGAYGVPRATKDVDLLVAVTRETGLTAVMKILDPLIGFDAQVAFDTLTWGRRHVGTSRTSPPYKVEFFELFDDPFVQEEFRRRREVFVPMLNRAAWLPSAEDVVVQKLRWGRSKDLDDARDILAVQGAESLDMVYIEDWCARHGTTGRLQDALANIPPL
ncbi:MAG TPA: hypothetical protein VIS74_02570 [Chthoniobacterales bacterium]